MPNHQPLHEAIRVAVDPMTVLQRIVQQALVLLPQADGASLEVRRDTEVLEYLAATGTLASQVGLQPDAIKLDRSLIVGVHADPIRR